MVSIPVDMSALVDGDLIDAADVRTPLNNIKAAIDDTLNGEQAFDQINYGTATEVTISGGVIDIDGKTNLRLDTEGNAASDELDTINGGTQGDILYLRLEDAARTVTVKHNTGNIYLSLEADSLLDDANKTLVLFYNGTRWTSGDPTTLVKNNFAAIVAPLFADDVTDGYSIGSRWYDTSYDAEYSCLDATADRAVWRKTTNEEYALIRDVKAQNTSGGTFTSGAWQTRDINDLTSEFYNIGIYAIPFTSGGTEPILSGDTVTGATSSAAGTVSSVDLQSGSWTDGTAAGVLWFTGVRGTFVGENLNVSRGLVIYNNDATTTGVLTSNQIRLVAGNWRGRIETPAYAVNSHQCALYDVTNSIYITYGTSAKSASGALTTTTSVIVTQFYLSEPRTYEIHHRCQTTRATDGFGIAANFADEVYTIAEFWRV